MQLTIQEIQKFETEMLKEIHTICERNRITYFLAYGSVLGAVRHGGPIPWDTDGDIVIPYDQLQQFITVARKELSDKFYLDFYDTNRNYVDNFPRIGLKGYSSQRLHFDIFILCGAPDSRKMQMKFIKQLSWIKKIIQLKKFNLYYFDSSSFKSILFHVTIKILLTPIPIKWVLNKYYKYCEKFDYSKADYVVNSSGGYGLKEILPKMWLGNGVYIQYDGLSVRVPEQMYKYLTHFYEDYMTLPPEAERTPKDYYEIKSI